MTEETFTPVTRIRHRRDTPENWTLYNPVLQPGEIGVEMWDLPNPDRFKIGDGETSWDELDYFVSETTVLDDIDGAIETLSTNLGVGNLDDLSTDDKSSIVAAINEINDGVSLELLYENAKAG